MKLLFIYIMGALFPFILCNDEICSKDPRYGRYDNDTKYNVENVRDGVNIPKKHWRGLRRYLENEIGNSSDCSALYQRFSTEHTYCKISTCDIITSGVTEEDKKFILEMHNSLRNKLAIGEENRYKQMPPSANMMEMEWDDELARIAQAHANLCIYNHDSAGGRKVENFDVGQNLMRYYNTAMKRWKGAEGWYKEEVCFYSPDYNHPFRVGNYGHFTQLTWANSWKLGCGFTAYRKQYGTYGLYTCNYGPSGNAFQGTHYIVGDPCSRCPKNTKCSEEYPGLCKSLTEIGPQKTKIPSDDFLLLCDFSEDDPEACNNVIVTGPRNLTTRRIYTGDYKTIILQGGESITIDLGKARNREGVCPFVYTRHGSNNAKDAFGSKVKLEFTFGRHTRSFDFPKPRQSSYRLLKVDIDMSSRLKIKFKLEVEEDAAPQYFDVQAWGIFKDDCKNSIYIDNL